MRRRDDAIFTYTGGGGGPRGARDVVEKHSGGREDVKAAILKTSAFPPGEHLA